MPQVKCPKGTTKIIKLSQNVLQRYVNQNIKSPRYRKVPVNDRWRLNNIHVIKHQRHSNIQDVNLYQHRIASQRKRQIVISRYGCEMKPLSSSAWASGMAGLTVAWPTGSGWSWDTSRSPTAGSAALSVGGLQRPRTDRQGLVNGSSRPLTSASRLPASVRLTRTHDFWPQLNRL